MGPPTLTVQSAKKTPGTKSTTPQPVRKNSVKRSLTHSKSTSVLPKPGQPVSFRSTIARLNQDTEGLSSKSRQGGTLERRKNLGSTSSTPSLTKENPKGLASVTTKLGTGLGKLKKSVSSNVLKNSTNKH